MNLSWKPSAKISTWITSLLLASIGYSKTLKLSDYCHERPAECKTVTLKASNGQVWKGYTVLVKNARVLENGRVLDSLGREISDSGPSNAVKSYSAEMKEQAKKYQSEHPSKKKKTVKVKGRLAVITKSGQDNYFHWMIQVFPRIKILSEAKLPYDALLFHPLTRRFQKESVELAKIDSKKLRFYGDDEELEVEEVLLTSIPYVTSQGWEEFPVWIHDFWDALVPIDRDGNYPKHLLLSRNKALTRRIHNEGALLKEFPSFQSVILENYSLLQQANYFRNAEFIIAPHGAGLANLVFARPKTRFIELFDPSAPNSVFKNLARRLQIDYKSFVSSKTLEAFGIEAPIALIKESMGGGT